MSGSRSLWHRGVGIGLVWLASCTVAMAATVPDTLEQRVMACTSCHGKHGGGGDNGFNPRLAGKPARYLYRQLLHFRDGRRHYPMMRHMVTGLSDSYLREIAGYFAAQTPAYPAPVPLSLPPALRERARTLVENGDRTRDIPACAACHGKHLTGREPGIPALVGLPPDYIRSQLGAWRNGSRRADPPDCMAAVAKRLDANDIHQVAAWLAAQPVPDDARPAPAGGAELPMHCGSAAE